MHSNFNTNNLTSTQLERAGSLLDIFLDDVEDGFGDNPSGTFTNSLTPRCLSSAIRRQARKAEAFGVHKRDTESSGKEGKGVT